MKKIIAIPLMNKDPEKAFIWIVSILQRHKIPFQIAGGLAAITYGGRRPLEDIDIDIPEEQFPLVKAEVKDFIIYGPDQFKDALWDLMLMTLNYHGQLIDLSGAFQTKIYNKKTNSWQHLTTNLSTAQIKTIFDMEVPVISRDQLIYYKRILARPVDLIDIEQIS